MAKRRIKKYYRTKGRWSANIKTLTNSNIDATPGTFFATSDLCANPVQTDNSVSQQYTVKNVEVSFEIEFNPGQGSSTTANLVEGLVSYIMFVPQGMTVTETYPNTHPEYIMAYKFYGSPNYELSTTNYTPARNAVRIKTRLSRRLQTGDKIILLIVGNNSSSSTTISLDYNGIVRWWTKAN